MEEIIKIVMEGTIWEKMIDSIDDHIHIEYVNADKCIIQGQNECAKACERVCIQSQIDLLHGILKEYNIEKYKILSNGGKIKSFDSIAISKIQELKKQL